MKKFNWKTTLFGASAIIGGIVSIIKGNIPEGTTAIFSGIGLLFAKDFNVTGDGK